MCIVHYDFRCPNCGQEYLDLIEGALVFDSNLYRIYKCDDCKILDVFEQSKPHTCQCGKEMILWDYKCPKCGTLMIQEETGTLDCF